MRRFFIKIIEIYQKIPLPTHFLCRFQPTCSEYMKQAIEQFGIIGFFMGIRRILRCNPFCKGGYDPVLKDRYKKDKVCYNKVRR